MTVKYWIGGTGAWTNANDANWSLSSGGANNTTHPITGDDVKIDANSGTGTVSRSAAAVVCSSLDCTGYTGTLNMSGAVNTTFDGTGASGDLKLVTGMTFTPGSGTLIFTGTGTQILTSAGKTTFRITQNGTGTLQLADSVLTQLFTHTKGTLDLNTKLMVATTFTGSNANTRAIIWTGGGNILTASFTITTTTGLTFTNPTQGSIQFGGGALGPQTTQVLSAGAGVTIPPMVVVPATNGTLTLTSGSNITSITQQDETGGGFNFVISLAGNITVDGSVSISVPRGGAGIGSIKSDVGGTPRTLTVNGTWDVTQQTLFDITAAGNTPFHVRGTTPADDGLGNTNVKFVERLDSGLNLMGAG